jgi:hypothetical protein
MNGIGWAVYKRYSEFAALRDRLAAVEPQVATIPFPPKALVFLAGADLEQRRAQLFSFMQRLFAGPIAPSSFTMMLELLLGHAWQVEAAARAAEAVGDIVFEGLQPGDIVFEGEHMRNSRSMGGEHTVWFELTGAEHTGWFELTEQTANGRPVWQAAGGTDLYAFVGGDGEWWIGAGKDMSEGRGAGRVHSAAEPGALTPDQVKGGWWQYDCLDQFWSAAPSLCVRSWTADERAAAERAQQQEAAARQAAEAVGDIVFEGLQPGEPGAHETGGFELTENAANGRAVWQAAGAEKRWGLYTFFGTGGKWWIGNGESMRAGKDAGWVASAAAEPDALTPDQVEGGWQAVDGYQ